MALGKQVTESGSVNQVAKDLDLFARMVEGRLKHIRGEVTNLAMTYYGLGSGAFQMCMGNWDDTAKTAVAAVDSLANKVNTGVGQAQQGDAQVASNMNRTGGQSGGGGGKYDGQVGGTYA